jgi:hypothetical protein
MRLARASSVVILSFVLVLATSAQQSATALPQASTYLQTAFGALAGATSVTDATLTGTARRIAGSDDESGTATLTAISGASALNLSFPSGPRSEVRNSTAGSWSGADGVNHAIAYHNLLTEPAWFFPTFAVANALSCPTCVVTYVGQETHNGLAVQHLSVFQQSTAFSGTGISFQHLTQIDLYLDSATLLPNALDFNIHPDDNALLDIPIEIQFSDYRSVNGAQVPFHVQKFLNNGLILDLQFQSVSLNTGLSATSFTVPQTQ